MKDMCKSCGVALVEEQDHSMKEISCPSCLSSFYHGHCEHCDKVRLIKHNHVTDLAGHPFGTAKWKECQTCGCKMKYEFT